MQGQITTYDNKKGVGRVQGEDGHIYRFTRNELAQGEDRAWTKTAISRPPSSRS